MIPNTTQTPNCIFDYWMSRLKGGELKVLLAVVRHTIGWLEDPKTGRRREKDHISHAKLVEMTGTSDHTITRAIAKLIDELGIVEALDEGENLLDNPEARRKVGQSQKPIYYRIPLEKFHPGGYPQNQDSSEETYRQKCNSSEETYRQKCNSHLPPKVQTKEKERSTKKKQTSAVRFPADWYKQNVDDYQKIKEVELSGDHEFGEIQRTLKTIYKAGHTPEDVRALMKAFEASKEEWTDNWTIHTVARKLPEFLAGKLFRTDGCDAPRIQALQDAIGEIDSFVEYKIDARLAKLSWLEKDNEGLSLEESEEKARLERIRCEKMAERAKLVEELKK